MAVAHALEHTTLDWAMIGFLLRLTVVRGLATTVADGVGFGPRAVVRRAPTGEPADAVGHASTTIAPRT